MSTDCGLICIISSDNHDFFIMYVLTNIIFNFILYNAYSNWSTFSSYCCCCGDRISLNKVDEKEG